MGLLYGTHMGPIWATRIWANPYGTHAEPGCTFHMGHIWAALQISLTVYFAL